MNGLNGCNPKTNLVGPAAHEMDAFSERLIYRMVFVKKEHACKPQPEVVRMEVSTYATAWRDSDGRNSEVALSLMFKRNLAVER